MRQHILGFLGWALFLGAFAGHAQPVYALSDQCRALEPSEIADYCLEWEANGYQDLNACIEENVKQLLQCGCEDADTGKPVGTVYLNENLTEVECQLFSPNRLGTVRRH